MVSGVVKLRPEAYFAASTERKSPRSAPRLEVGANLGIGRLSHAAPQRIAEDEPLIGDGLALEETVPRIGDGLLRASRSIWIALLGLGGFAGLLHDLSRLVAVLGGDVSMGLQDLFAREGLLLVACGVSCDLRGSRAANATPFHLIFDLLRPQARCIEIGLTITF